MASYLLGHVSSRLVCSSKTFFLSFRITNKLRRVFTVVMISALLCNPAAAATVETTPIATSFAQDMRYAFYSSGWAKYFGINLTSSTSQRGGDSKGSPKRKRPEKAKAETRGEREARVARIKIYPGDVEIAVGEKVIFTAVGEDSDSNAIGGLDVKWRGQHDASGNVISLSDDGGFSSRHQGKFTITAEIVGRQGSVKVTVKGGGNRAQSGNKTEIKSDSRELRRQRQSSMLAPASGNAKQLFASKNNKGKEVQASSKGMVRTPRIFDTYEEPDYSSSFADVGAERGNMPWRAYDAGVGSGNFQITAPAVSLDGRGIDVNLAFSYNSRLWHKDGSTVYFDIDRDWIPGWNIGFGKIVHSSTVGGSFMMIDADGTRHEHAGASIWSGSGNTQVSSYKGITTDGTFIDYEATGYIWSSVPNPDKRIFYARAFLSNGTSIEYGAAGNYAIYPTKITDVHGNYITVTYQNNVGPNITTITDTLNRVIRFHYDGNNLLTAITVPGLKTEPTVNPPERQVVRLAYRYLNLNDAGDNYGFKICIPQQINPPCTYASARQSTIPVITAIYYPGTNTGYWFNDPDSYSSYGMLRKVSERIGMTFNNAALNDQGSISAGEMSRELVYSNSSTPGYSGIQGLLIDTPLYTRMEEDWKGRQTGSKPVTEFSFEDVDDIRKIIVTRPDGVRNIQFSNKNTGSTHYGLMTQNATYPEGSDTPLSRSVKYFEDGVYYSSRPARIESYDERGRMTYVAMSYGSIFNAPTDIREYGWTGQLLKRVHTEYLNNETYIGAATTYGGRSGRHIFNLPLAVEVRSSDTSVRVSRTEYEYDGKSLIDAPNVTNFDITYNPHSPDETVCHDVPDPSDPDCQGLCNSDCDSGPPCYPGCDLSCPYIQECSTYNPYNANTRFRGDVTKTTTYADATNLNGSTAIVANFTYDITGNVRIQSTSCCEQATFNYAIDTDPEWTAYAWPKSITRGSVGDPASQNTTRAIYDFNTGLVIESYDANGGRSNVVYDANSLRPVVEYSPTGAYIYHVYHDAELYTQDFAYEAGKSSNDFASHINTWFDGKGRVRTNVTHISGNWNDQDVVETKYDNLGRVWMQTSPYRYAVDEIKWTSTEYDVLDRPIKITSPDGSEVKRFYNESTSPSSASSNVGQTVRSVDAWGRERWGRFDEQNRLVEVVEPNPNGDGSVTTGGMSTQYTYDIAGNLVHLNQGGQVRYFRYDALGRLTHQKLAERDGTLDDAGNWVGSGPWSDAFAYDTRSNLTLKVDARGVKTHFAYNNDPLNRLQGIIYDKSGVPSSLASNILDAPNVSYAYVTSGDRMRVTNVSVAGGFGNQEIYYDIEGRVSEVREASRGGIQLYTNYLWDTLDRVKEVRYPQQIGVANEPRKVIVHNYDVASRLKDLKYGSETTPYVTMASAPVFNASSQITSLTVGNQITEKYDFDPKTGLLLGQQVNKGSENLLNLKYNYTLNNDPNNNDGAKTGQLTSIIDVKNQARNRAFNYDSLGRLMKVKGGGANPISTPDWEQIYSYDRYGNRTTKVTPEPIVTDIVWVDDSVPTGATLYGHGGDGWNWVNSNPAPVSGGLSHQSNIADESWSPAPYSGSVSSQTPITTGVYQHVFWASPQSVYVVRGTLYAYVYLDPENVPEEIMLQWGDISGSWEHRAYWGANKIAWGADGTTARKYMGALPAAGGWVRLELPASTVGLEQRTVNSMAFTIFGGRANWDKAGIDVVYDRYETVCCCGEYVYDVYCDCMIYQEYCHEEHYEDYVSTILIDDSIPAGAQWSSDSGSWNWVGADSRETIHQHYFEDAVNKLEVKTGDILYQWVYLDPANMPKEIMLQWNEANWEHRAYWGANKIGWGADGTAARKYMGGLPAGGGWVKLEVPASAVGLEGKSVDGMAFTLYGGRAAWDRSGLINTSYQSADTLVMSKDGFANLSYNPTNNRITNNGFEYDPAGNQTAAIINTSNTQQKYKYDSANRLRQVFDVNGTLIADYLYGSSNERIAFTENGVTTWYAREDGQVIAEYEAVGASGLQWKMSYVYMGGRLLATEQSNGIRYHHPDGLGTRLVTDASDGVVVTENMTMPFGNQSAGDFWQNPDRSNLSKKKFTSYDRSDSTGLDYAVNRQYSSVQGRFTQVDPIGMASVNMMNPQSLNLFAYCANDPVNSSDPTGLDMEGDDFWSGGGGGYDITGYNPWTGAIRGSFDTGGGEAAEREYEGRVKDTFDANRARSALDAGDGDALAALFERNPNIGIEVDGDVSWGMEAADLVNEGMSGSIMASLDDSSGGTIYEQKRGGGNRGRNTQPNLRRDIYRANMARRSARESRGRSMSTTAPRFPGLRDHASRHGGGMSRGDYYNAALNHINSAGLSGSLATRRVRTYHEGQWKWYYISRVGPDNYIFTSTTANGRHILTHMRDKIVGGGDRIDARYLIRQGVKP